MKLFYSPTSPFARNVLAVIDHHGFVDKIEVVLLNPFEDRARLQAANPLGKVPALQLADGTVVYDSPVVIDYLDQSATGESLLKHDTLPPYIIRTLFALSNGVLEAALLSVMEMRRPENEQSAMWLSRWEENILTATKVMAGRLPELDGKTNLLHFSFAVTLDYLMFRLPHIDWRSGNAELAAWADNQLEKEFYKRTDPRLAD